MPAEVYVPVRAANSQTQDSSIARRLGGAFGFAGLEHVTMEKTGIPNRKLQPGLRESMEGSTTLDKLGQRRRGTTKISLVSVGNVLHADPD